MTFIKSACINLLIAYMNLFKIETGMVLAILTLKNTSKLTKRIFTYY